MLRHLSAARIAYTSPLLLQAYRPLQQITIPQTYTVEMLDRFIRESTRRYGIDLLAEIQASQLTIACSVVKLPRWLYSLASVAAEFCRYRPL